MVRYQFLGVLKLLDVAQCHMRTNFAHIVVDSVLDIPQS